MIQSFVSKFILALILIALQALIFNHIHIFGYATPLICVYFLLTLPLNMPKWSKLLWGFCIGIIQDSFTNTPGAMAATLTFMALIQDPLLIVLGGQNENDKEDIVIPSIKAIGAYQFLRYAAVAILIQNIIFYMLMAFTVNNIIDTAINIGGSTVLSFLIVWFIESIRSNYIK